LYRRRWQIELLFKRLKSLALIGHVPKHDARSSRAWLYGKLLVALLAEKLIRVGHDISPHLSNPGVKDHLASGGNSALPFIRSNKPSNRIFHCGKLFCRGIR
jgi:hypothetical protein